MWTLYFASHKCILIPWLNSWSVNILIAKEIQSSNACPAVGMVTKNKPKCWWTYKTNWTQINKKTTRETYHGCYVRRWAHSCKTIEVSLQFIPASTVRLTSPISSARDRFTTIAIGIRTLTGDYYRRNDFFLRENNETSSGKQNGGDQVKKTSIQSISRWTAARLSLFSFCQKTTQRSRRR